MSTPSTEPPNLLARLLPGAGDLPAFAALLAAYLATAVAGLQWTVVPGAGTAVWPGSGIAFAALALGGLRLWPAVFLGRFLVAAIVNSPQPWWADLAIAGSTALGAVVPVALIRRGGRLDPRLDSLRDMARLIGLGAGLGAVISGVLATATVWASGTPPARLAHFFETWGFGFAVGVLLFAPLVLTWSRPSAWRRPLGEWLHLAVCLAAVTGMGALVFLSAPFQPFRTWHLFPVLVWAALAFNTPGAALALTITAGLTVYSAVMGLGPLSEIAQGPIARLLVAQQFIAASAVTILILAAVADERRAKEQLARIAAQLRREAEERTRLFEAAQREIAVRTRAEDRQKLLINELNHRVKNTLATVQSIAAQTARRATDPARAYDAFLERLMALSRAHDVLTRQQWEGAELAAVAAGAVQPFETRPGERFRLSGPAVWLEPQAALALAMALHELATNASKHGALSVAGGKVRLDWAVRPQDAEAHLTLTWRETGGPPVTAPTRKGFGSRLLERGLPSDLGGTVSLDYRPDGLVCTIEARLPAVDAAAAQ